MNYLIQQCKIQLCNFQNKNYRYTKLFETLKSLHKSLSKSNRELQTKLVFYKRDFDIHIQKKVWIFFL